jgi:hypothetical protein
MHKIIAIALLAFGLTACYDNREHDYSRSPGQTTVIENPGQPTVIVTQPSQGTPLRLCDNKAC